uniref:Glycosyltransferase n=1 Tax=Zea mays TaxID=4577 RepID=B6SNQ2_MAIZE|nr:anthocyanidin 3-O-glucosyltransferase [Zea mays]
MAQMEREHLSVVMFPWLAHGHVTPYLKLARRLTSANDADIDVTVHLVSTPVNLSAIARHQTPRIRFAELHLPAAPDLPPELHTTKHLPARLMPALKRACDLAAPRFGALLDEIRPDLLLFDFLYPWAPLEAAARGVPAAHLSTFSAAATSFVVHCLGRGRREGCAFPFRGVGFGSAEEEAKYMAQYILREELPDALVPERNRLLLSLARSSAFVAVKTCADVERPYMDYLSELVGGNKEMVPVGPLLVDADAAAAAAGGGTSSESESDRVMRWLDAQTPASVVLVCFGSEYFMSEQQLARMARGLELSGERFVWVVRFPRETEEGDEAARALPRGFAPAPGRGLVVEGWAPQRRILAHPACGAFLSHCGWSSVLESLAAGVPIVALPLHIDQPLDANLATELGAAVRVQQERFGEFRAEDVARAVRRAMRGEESHALRRRAAELREVVARNDADDAQVAALVQRMARLCGKGQQRVAVPN